MSFRDKKVCGGLLTGRKVRHPSMIEQRGASIINRDSLDCSFSLTPARRAGYLRRHVV
jgi:hypothetical protein